MNPIDRFSRTPSLKSVLLVPALCLWALTGCATDTATSETPAAESAESAAAETPEVTESSEASEEETATQEAALPPEPKEPEIDDDPDRLLGLGTQGLFVLLGEPELVRRESPAQVWQYRGLTCVFDVFLYEKNNAEEVTYVEARDNQGDKTEARACLNQLLKARLES